MKLDVVIPAYRVRSHVIPVVQACLQQPLVRKVVVVDDACPEQSGETVRERFGREPRVTVLAHATNQGVGGAMLTGYAHAFADGADVVVKVDGDGQMPPALIPRIAGPVLRGDADYAKGNRFFFPRDLEKMPRVRLFGNAALSLVNKISSGYWSVMDPTNGYTALHRCVYQNLEPAKVARDYFFESDVLYRLGIVRAVVADVPMPVIYADETSSLSVLRTLYRFPLRFLSRFLKRIVYHYFLRDFSMASLQILLGLPLLIGGVAFGSLEWSQRASLGIPTPAGTAMIVGLLILMGFQLLLSAVNYDLTREPRLPLQKLDAEASREATGA